MEGLRFHLRGEANLVVMTAEVLPGEDPDGTMY